MRLTFLFRYRELVEGLNAMLESLPQRGHVWKHLVGTGRDEHRRIGCVGNVGGVITTATSAVLDDARQATDAELLLMGTHTVRAAASLHGVHTPELLTDSSLPLHAE